LVGLRLIRKRRDIPALALPGFDTQSRFGAEPLTKPRPEGHRSLVVAGSVLAIERPQAGIFGTEFEGIYQEILDVTTFQ
jgi:hypothetical protein